MEDEMLTNKDKPEYVICSAIWFDDGNKYNHQPINIETGFVICGRRHHNCFMSLSIAGGVQKEYEKVQGFLTSKDIFLDRKEAGKLAFEQRQIPELTDCLFSEDLY